jgi:tetratricopeptide (TPR) repeat protein
MKRLFLPICVVLITCGGLAQAPLPQADSLTTALKTHPQEDSIRVQLLIGLIRSVIYNSPDSAMKYSNEVLRISGKIGLSSGIAFGYRYKGLVYYLNGDYIQALDYLQQALKAAESLHSKKFDASMFNNLAIVYMELKQYGRALSYYQKYLSASRELGLPEEEAKALLNIGNLYGETDDVENGLIYCNQSLSLSSKNGYSVVTASALNSLAILYKKKKDYPAAIGAFQKSIDLSRKMGNLFNEATALNGAAEVYVLMQDYAKAAQYANQGLAVARQVNALKWEADSWSDLSDIYAHQHQYAKALDAYRNFTVLHDSLMNDEKKQEFTRKDLQYEFDKKSALVKAGNDKQQALDAAEIGRQRVVRNAVIGGAALLLLASVMSLVFYKRRRDAEGLKKEAEFRARVSDTEMKALRSQMNPHFIFNSLNSISDYISRNDIPKANEYLVKFAGIMRMILEYSEQKEISLADDLKALELYIQLEALRLRNKFSYEICVGEGIDRENTLVPPMMLQPFVENSIWHGLARKEGEGKLSIHVYRQDEMIKYAVEDNGIGRAGASEVAAAVGVGAGDGSVGSAGVAAGAGRKSMGIKITGERIALINQTRKAGGSGGENAGASLRLSDLEPGTRVEVWLPLGLNF